MAVDDRSGEIPCVGPADRETQPPHSNQGDADAQPNNIPIDNQHTSSQNQRNDSGQEPRWGRSFSKLMQKSPKADAWLAVFTFILAIETALTIRILSATDSALHHTANATDRIGDITEADDRAWIAPEPPFMTEIPRVGSPAKVAIRHANVGHSPATEIKVSLLFDVIPVPTNSDFANTELVTENFCEGHPPTENFGAQYPNTGTATYYTTSKPVLWTPVLQEEKALLRIRNCISYKTFGKIHYAWSCFIFLERHKIAQASGPTIAAAPVLGTPDIVGFVAADCRGGSGAD